MVRTIRIVVVYPDLLGTYGDGGNGIVLARRAEWRGWSVELVDALSDRPLPEADLYCLGGGEDEPQARAVEALESDGTLIEQAGNGAVVLAVCAGFQILGRSFPGRDGAPVKGLGLLDAQTTRGRVRAVGEVLARPGSLGTGRGAVELPALTGFENHSGLTTLGSHCQPLARVVRGVGNGDGTEGVVSGRIVGTYLHGPVLARNPALADLLLAWTISGESSLAPLDDEREEALRAERIAAHRPGRLGLLRSRRQR